MIIKWLRHVFYLALLTTLCVFSTSLIFSFFIWLAYRVLIKVLPYNFFQIAWGTFALLETLALGAMLFVCLSTLVGILRTANRLHLKVNDIGEAVFELKLDRSKPMSHWDRQWVVSELIMYRSDKSLTTEFLRLGITMQKSKRHIIA